MFPRAIRFIAACHPPGLTKPAFILPSSETGTHYKIYVAAPPSPPDDASPWPAVLFMDGDD